MSETPNGTPPIDRQNLEARLDELTAENERLRNQLARLRTERDDYLNVLRKIAPEHAITEEDIMEVMRNGISGRQVLAELEELVRKAS